MKVTLTLSSLFLLSIAALGQQADGTFKPVVGQPGKDVVWVPTPQETVDRMLDVAKVTPQDYVIDLGSGDGRNVISAARRGARALGVEWNQEMVDLSKRVAGEAGLSGKAEFVQGDMYAADISQASVMALFLLVDNMQKLMPKFLGLRPGTRIVANTFGFGDAGWEPRPYRNRFAVYQLVHGPPLDRSGRRRGCLAVAAGNAHAFTEVSECHGNAWGHSHLQRQDPGPRTLIYRQRSTIYREGGRRCDGGRQRHTGMARDPLFACRRNAATKIKDAGQFRDLMAQRRGELDRYHQEVLAALREIGDPRFGAAVARDRGSSLKHLGISFPALRARVRQGFSFYDLDELETLAVWDHLWRTSPYGDVLFAALEYYAPRVRKRA